MGDVKLVSPAPDISTAQKNHPFIIHSSHRAVERENDHNNNEEDISLHFIVGPQTAVPEKTPVNSIKAEGHTLTITGIDLRRREYNLEKREKLDPEEINMDPSVLGQHTKNLNPLPPKKYDEFLKKKYISLMESVGLYVFEGGTLTHQATINPNWRSVIFGSETYPAELLKTTLKTQWKTETSLCFLHISWRKPLNGENRSGRTLAAEALSSFLVNEKKGFLIHIWSLPTHKDSVFGVVDLDEFKESSENCKRDLVDIYVHISEDKSRVSVLSLSDHSLTLHCGRWGTFSIPPMKAAFSNVTGSDVHYKLREEVLQNKKTEVNNTYEESKEFMT